MKLLLQLIGLLQLSLLPAVLAVPYNGTLAPRFGRVTFQRRATSGSPTKATQNFAYYTSADASKMLSFTSPNIFSGTATKSSPTITIDPTTVYQTMAGAGAALTDATVGLLAAGKAGDPNGYSAFLADMFNRYTGLSIVRVPIGATDFSTDLYTLADAVPTANATSDPVTAIAQSFSSARLLSGPVPLLQDILAVRSDLKVMLSPWSAPPWSKQNQAFSGGWLLTGFENAYGEYLAQTVSAYQSAGINIYGLTVQNEPSFAASYPSTRLTSTQQNMVAGYLKNRLQALGYGSIQVFTHDDNFDQWASARDTVLANSANVDGVGFHCYRGNATGVLNFASAMTSNNLNKAIHFTECSGIDEGTSSFVSSMQWWFNNLYRDTVKNGASSVTSWNMILDQNHGPRLPSAYCKNCEGSVTYTGTQISYNDIYYSAQHFGSVVNSADTPTKRIGFTSSKSCITGNAYMSSYSSSQSNRYGIEMINACGTAGVVVLKMGKQTATYNLLPGLHSLVFTA